MKKLDTPEFKNETEEALWWEGRDADFLADLKQAQAEGTLTYGTVARKAGIPTTTIRLEPTDIELARTQAEKRGLKYQTYLKMLIHEALLTAEAKG